MKRLAFLILMLFATSAQAHDWYTYRTDPVTGSRCCGGNDCKPVPAEASWVTRTPTGLHIVMSLEETKLINKSSIAAINETVPWDRVQEAQIDDHDNLNHYHLCISPYPTDPVETKKSTRFYCVFQNSPGT